jgi:hypothetical protein
VTAAIWERTILFAAVSLLSSCSFFLRQPPLPRHAAIESTGSDEKFAGLIEDADIIYFPSESVALGSRTEAAWKLLEALRRNENSFALGWDVSAGDQLKHRGFLTEAAKSGAQILGLQPPAGLAADEIARGFEPPPGDFERFARRLSSRHVSEVKLRAAYEAALLAEQFAAEKIAAYFRDHRNEKMLVFLRQDQLGRDHGVPYFVSQKTKARQLILNPQRHAPAGPGLLARN